MITFFRSIRKQLSSGKENHKLRQYLAYAFGEIFLVMVGILLALEVNNWNEKNKLREYQESQLGNLSTEMVAMKAFLSTQIGYFERAIKSNQAFLYIMESEGLISASSDSINNLIRNTLNTDLVTSERLSLETKIDFKLLTEHRYDELQKRLLDWRHFAERIGADFQLIEDNREDDFQKALLNAGIPGWQVLFRNYDPPNFPINYQALVRNQEVYAVLYYRLKRTEAITRDLYTGIEELDFMLSEINTTPE